MKEKDFALFSHHK